MFDKQDFYDKKEVFVNVKQGDKWKALKKKKIKTAPKRYTLPNLIHNPIIIIHSVAQCHIFMNKLSSYALKAHPDD